LSQSDEARRDHLVVQELTDAMTRRELAAALERLSFTDGYSLIKVDPGVRSSSSARCALACRIR
jgi:hypothetical protein